VRSLRTFVGSTQNDWEMHAHLLDEQGRVVMTAGALSLPALT
jgi:hypothetical protein